MSKFNPALYLRKLGELRSQDEESETVLVTHHYAGTMVPLDWTDQPVCAFCSRAHMELDEAGRCFVCLSDAHESGEIPWEGK
jgi:hypothetical protein